MIWKFTVIPISLVLAILLACSAQPPPPTDTQPSTPILSPTEIPTEPSLTDTPELTNTPQPTPSPEQSPTPAPTWTPTSEPTPAPTWTPTPTPTLAPTLTPTHTPTPEPTATATPTATVPPPTLAPQPTYTPLPTYTPFPTQTPYPTPTSAPTKAPLPTATATPSHTPIPPTPLPAISANSGDWRYFGPDCPGAYDNCASFASESVFMSLRAYYDTNESFYDEPGIRISCFQGAPNFTFDSGGPWIGLGEMGLSVRYEDQDVNQGTWYRTDKGSDDLESVWFSDRDTQAILGFIENADRQSKNVTIGASSDYDTVVSDFDVTGFTANFQRLPCS